MSYETRREIETERREERHGGRDREKQVGKDRQTDRQTGRETDGQRDRRAKRGVEVIEELVTCVRVSVLRNVTASLLST